MQKIKKNLKCSDEFIRNYYFKFIPFIILSFLFSNLKGQDLRQYQHGIDFVPRIDGKYWVIWASSGNPPQGSAPDGSWTHDIYFSEINPSDPKIQSISTIISNPEAQEPASSVVCKNGNIMITMEDGWNTNNTIAQRYGVYDNHLNPINPYPQLVLDGGHSGHVTSVGNRFVVFYSEGWVDGGGVNNLGSGDDVMLKVYDSLGNYEKQREICVGSLTRDWWPLIAGAENYACLLWQRFVPGQQYVDLMYCIYDPQNNRLITEKTKLVGKVKYYTYNVRYIPSIKRFLVLGTFKSGGGFSYLINEAGKITAQNNHLPELVREAKPAIKNLHNRSYAAFPKYPGGIAVLELKDSTITLNNTIEDSYQWSYLGTDGIFTNNSDVYFVSLSKNGLVEKYFRNIIMPVKIRDSEKEAPRQFELGQNYPNPFNSTTKIPFSLNRSSHVIINVYDVGGKLIESCLNENKIPGKYEIVLKSDRLPSGIYFYQLKTEQGNVAVKKLVHVK